MPRNVYMTTNKFIPYGINNEQISYNIDFNTDTLCDIYNKFNVSRSKQNFIELNKKAFFKYILNEDMNLICWRTALRSCLDE